MDAVGVNDDKVLVGRRNRIGTNTADGVTKLNAQTKCLQRNLLKKSPVPGLKIMGELYYHTCWKPRTSIR